MSARPLVMKFGGTSVATPERLARVVEIVADARAQGAVAVVVSAMGDTTDRLIDAVEAAARGDAAQAEALVDGMADLAVQCAMGALATLEAPTDGVHATVRGLLRPLREVLHGVGLLRAEFMVADALDGVHPRQLLAQCGRDEFLRRMSD